ncbi:MAG: hypothetical protein LBN24_11505 [Mediterranea sp.]|jgi:hypothetical protein|nr:hypothetical protein [Mediterranea sp.]
MKKLLVNALAVCMALATGTLTSCSNEEDTVSTDGGKKVFMKFDLTKLSGATRGVSDPVAAGTALTLTKATIVFYVGTDFRVTETYTVTPAGTTGTGGDYGDYSFDQVKAGVEITGLDQATTNVSVVGNTAVNVAMGQHWSNYIDGHLINAGTQTGTGSIALYGKTALVQEQDGTYTADVTLAPIAARFEIPNVSAGNGLKSFTLKGIYMDKFYQTAKLNGNVNVNATDPITTLKGLTTVGTDLSNDYTTTGNPLAVNWQDNLFVTGQNVGVTETTPGSPGAGKVWGFYVFARPYSGSNMFGFNTPYSESTYASAASATGGTQVPRIIFELGDVVPTDPSSESSYAGKTWYATISGFTYLDLSTTTQVPVQSIVGGYVFSTPTSFSLTLGDLHPNPNPGKIDVSLTVTPMTWRTLEVTPVLQ